MKLEKEVVLYFPPGLIGNDEGACCGHCMMFIENGRCTSVAGAIDADKGVCGLYVHGSPRGAGYSGEIPKDVAGYTENGPTHCGSCRFYGWGDQEKGSCEVVEGTVEYHGCCNAWEGK